MRATVIPAVVIVLVGSILGLGFNSLRTDVTIKMTRNYFKVLKAPGAGGMLSQREALGKHGKPENRLPRLPPTAPREAMPPLPQHGFTVVTIDQVISMVDSDAAFDGYIVFVDARDNKHYEEGHIPRALQIDNYNVDKHFEQVKARIEGADTVVVYCGGGECKDSIYLATELEVRGVPFEKLRLFEGGMDDWRKADMPVDEGRDP